MRANLQKLEGNLHSVPPNAEVATPVDAGASADDGGVSQDAGSRRGRGGDSTTGEQWILVEGGEPFGAAFEVRGSPCDDERRSIEEPLFDLSTLKLRSEAAGARPLAAVRAGELYAYFSAWQGDGTDLGYGVARWDEARRRFVALALLWTSDRPNFGSGAVISDGYVYVYGGVPARFLDADVYIGRAPIDDIAEIAAYEYAASGGGYASSIDVATPMVRGGTAPSVAWHPGKQRWVLAYATPLGDVVLVRTGLGPTGPWSLPVELGRCALPSVDSGAFCGEVSLHPAFFGEDDLVLSHAVATWERPKNAKATDYWTRWVTAPWPVALP